MAGVLEGVTIVEMAGIGPGPFCGMMLADHGARVIRVDRAGSYDAAGKDVLTRNRERVEADLKTPEGIATVRDLVKTADGIFEGFRPGVMERLGLGPDVLLGDNPALIYGRMTGWGQTGTLSHAAGHDINYISITGNLHGYGRPHEKPTPPTNAIGDFAGGGMMLAFGMVAGILNARSTGQGQVIDCAMTDGAAVIHSMQWGFRNMGAWEDTRGVNLLDTAAHFYDTYECSDGKFISIGSIEPQFYALLRGALGLSVTGETAATGSTSRTGRFETKTASTSATKMARAAKNFFMGMARGIEGLGRGANSGKCLPAQDLRIHAATPSRKEPPHDSVT